MENLMGEKKGGIDREYRTPGKKLMRRKREIGQILRFILRTYAWDFHRLRGKFKSTGVFGSPE